jgi:hypothetical protein
VGLFSWLFGERKPERVVVTDYVWMNADSRARAVVAELTRHVHERRSVLLLAHFPSTLEALAPELLGANLPRESISGNLSPESALKLAATGEPRVLFGLVRNLRVPEFPAPDDAPDSPLPVELAERHFLRRHDDRVTEFAACLSGRATVAVHMSLDDPLLKLFAGEWVANTLRQLGMQPDEAIESAMIGRRIRAAQEKMLSTLGGEEEVPADSPAEWLRENARR